MKFSATIHIMPRKEILDPQGKATLLGLKNLGLEDFDHLRIGKRIETELEADSQEEATEKLTLACNKLLSNPIIEQYHFELTQV
ncbi:MAG: phosphoribosylformylglycinamidine synthase subunit PurS [Bacteroidota bacterium]